MFSERPSGEKGCGHFIITLSSVICKTDPGGDFKAAVMNSAAQAAF
jgi:hypothetical protein